jgi:hypothetical protein
MAKKSNVKKGVFGTSKKPVDVHTEPFKNGGSYKKGGTTKMKSKKGC